MSFNFEKKDSFLTHSLPGKEKNMERQMGQRNLYWTDKQ